MAKDRINDVKPDFNPEENPGVTELVLTLAKYVKPTDVGMERINFLRTVTARILDDIGF